MRPNKLLSTALAVWLVAAACSPTERDPADGTPNTDTETDTATETDTDTATETDTDTATETDTVTDTDTETDTVTDTDTATDAEAETDTDTETDTETDTDTATATDTTPDTDTGIPPEPPPALCDAGDRAWLQRAFPLLTGRHPRGIRELQVLEALIAQTSRAAVAEALMADTGFIERWRDVIRDAFRVARDATQHRPDCHDLRHAPLATSPALAIWVRDHAATDAMPADLDGAGLAGAATATMADLLGSALVLDDLSPWLRAQLFSMIHAAPAYCMNTPLVEMDMARRRALGGRFAQTYLGRGIVCAGCHNSAWAVNDSADPALDRHWPIPGLYEKALYGADDGRPEDDVYAAFRVFGVRSKASLADGAEADAVPDDPAPAIRPFDLTPACGSFVPEASVVADPAGAQAFLGAALSSGDGPGPKATIWHVEKMLRVGVDSIRAKVQASGDVPPLADLAVSAEASVAVLLASRLANVAWQEVWGSPLVLGHGFSRNAAQRDRLVALTRLVLREGWALRPLLVAVVTDPVFNRLPPAAGCEAPYALDALFDPHANESLDPAVWGNTIGDGLHRLEGRTLVRVAAEAMHWHGPDDVAPAPDGKTFDVSELATLLGAWVGPDAASASGQGYHAVALWRAVAGGGTPYNITGFFALGGTLPGGLDVVDATLQLAEQTPGATVADVVEALSDRLRARTQLGDAEAALIAQALGFGAEADGAALDVPLGQAPEGWTALLRPLVGAWLTSPAFTVPMLAGPTATLAGSTPEAPVLPKADPPPSLVLEDATAVGLCQWWGDALVQSGGASDAGCDAAGQPTVTP